MWTFVTALELHLFYTTEVFAHAKLAHLTCVTFPRYSSTYCLLRLTILTSWWWQCICNDSSSHKASNAISLCHSHMHITIHQQLVNLTVSSLSYHTHTVN